MQSAITQIDEDNFRQGDVQHVKLDGWRCGHWNDKKFEDETWHEGRSEEEDLEKTWTLDRRWNWKIDWGFEETR